MRLWMRRWSVILLVGPLLGVILGCGHDPNHDIDMVKARAAADRVHKPPKLTPEERAKVMHDHGG